MTTSINSILFSDEAAIFLRSLRSKETFSTFAVAEIIREELVVDIGQPVHSSRNAAIGRSIKKAASVFGIREIKRKQHIKINGTWTKCSIWIKE